MKYPRVPHVMFSNPFDDDLVLSNEIKGKRWIATEKLDGSQVSIEFDRSAPKAFNRNKPISGGGMDRQFHLLPTWVKDRYDRLYGLLGERHIVFGEWLFHLHTVVYDRLPDWFIAFGIFDKEDDDFLGFYDAKTRCGNAGIEFVPIVFDGVITSNQQVLEMIQTSKLSTHRMEGVVLHSPDGRERCKYVTPEFKASVDSARHWRSEKRTRNTLLRGDGKLREGSNVA